MRTSESEGIPGARAHRHANKVISLAQLTREFTRAPGILPATLVALPPRQAALEETFMEVTRGASDDRTPATTGGSPPRRSW